MGNHFYFHRGKWSFHSWCGHDFEYDPETHMIRESWLYTDYAIMYGDATREAEQFYNPLEVNFKTPMGEDFKELLSFLSTCLW